LYDQRSVINDRCNYLRKIRKFREDGYEIVYLDETWVNQNHATDYMWLPVDGSDAPKIPSGKGKWLIALHAGNREEGLIDRCDLVFLAKAKDGDYHQEMNGPTFLKLPSKQSDVGKSLSQRYTLRSYNVILLRRHNVLLWTPQHVNTTIHTTSSQCCDMVILRLNSCFIGEELIVRCLILQLGKQYSI
jgi:hypothetical protein